MSFLDKATDVQPEIQEPSYMSKATPVNYSQLNEKLNPKEEGFFSKAMKFISKPLGSAIQAQNPLLGTALQTETGQSVAGKVLEVGKAGLKEAAKPFLQPFVTTAETLTGKPQEFMGVKSTPTPKEAILEAGEAILTATGLKTGSRVIKAASKLLPNELKTAEKALSLTKEELAAVDKTKLKYLGTKGFEMIKTTGGFLKPKVFQMTSEVKKLAKEFRQLLTEKNPEKNIVRVQAELGRLQKVSKLAFEGVNKAINKNQVISGIKKAITDMSDTVYESMPKANQIAYTEKRIAEFLSHVKEGTLRGLDDALEAFRAANIKGDATLSKASDATYQAVKKYIISNLPAEKAAAFKNANQTQAKLFDLAEILKGKIEASVGESVIKKVAPYLGAGAGGAAIVEVFKRVGD